MWIAKNTKNLFVVNLSDIQALQQLKDSRIRNTEGDHADTIFKRGHFFIGDVEFTYQPDYSGKIGVV